MTTAPTTLGLLGLTLLLVASPLPAESPVPPTTAPSTAPEAAGLDAQIERMLQRLEAKRVALNIPGLAIAVVKDDEVILSTGLGLADIRDGRAATDETRFAIGSTTKAFTATLIGMLVDEGVMGWDDPVRSHLPNYHLADADADEKVVIRDLLCHRIGLASLTMLWYGLDLSREEVLEKSYEAELLYPFRDRFNYSNISFLAAGEAAAHATGIDWNTLVSQRLLAPLGMTTANTTIDAARDDPGMAIGYRWLDEEKTHEIHAYRSADAVAPAGSINASARDMAQWLRFQLARGERDGERLISREQHKQTWTSHIELSPGRDYGLGWFVGSWKDHRMIEHGGGIDGFTAEVALLPDEGIGFVVLANLFATPVAISALEIVFGSLLEDEPVDRPDVGAVSEDYDELIGNYTANFGTFKNTTFEVRMDGDDLAVDVPGQMLFALHPPDADGFRTFKLTDQIRIRFNRDKAGAVVSLTMRQAGMAFELPREGVEIAAEIDLVDARRHLGSYHAEKLGTDVEIVIQNNRLAVDVPGQMVYELHAPDEKGRWVLRVKDTLWIVFREDEAKRVTGLAFVQDGVEHEHTRVGPVPDPAAASESVAKLIEVLDAMGKAMGRERLASFRSLKATGTARWVHMGLSGTAETFIGRDGKQSSTFDFGRFGTMRSLQDGSQGWVIHHLVPESEMKGDLLTEMKLEYWRNWWGDWTGVFDTVKYEGTKTFDDRPVHVVVVELGSVEATAYIDVETHQMIARRAREHLNETVVADVTYRFSDFRVVVGATLPHRIEIDSEMAGRFVLQYDSMQPDVDLPDFHP